MTRKWVCGQKPGQSLTSKLWEQTKFSSHQSTNFRVRYPACLDRFQVIALKLWIRTVQTVFEGLGKERRKGTRETMIQWEEHLVCHSNWPERTREDQSTVSLTPWNPLSWGLGLFLTSCCFPRLLYSFPDHFFLCLLQQMLSHPDSLDALYTDTV